MPTSGEPAPGAPQAGFGVRSMVAPLRRALVRTPALGDFAAAGWRPPERTLLAAQHLAFVELLDGLGVDVVVAPPAEGLVDACFTYDPAFVTARGAIRLCMAKAARRGEPALLVADLEASGVPLAGALDGEAVADGGDMLWLDEGTLGVARGYRTNAEAHRQLAALLALEEATLERFDLPHHRGPAHVLHLMSVVSPVAQDIAVVFEPLAPVPLLEALAARGIRTIPCDPHELDLQGCNVLAVRPGVCVVADSCPVTRRTLERAGCEVHAYAASELNKGDGGPTCLTRPILRDEG
jgi:N-dimethylarginine dimethylaminohydrolase